MKLYWSAFVLTTMLMIVIFVPYVIVADPMQTNAAQQLRPPDAQYWFGTDLLGRDVFSRVIYGGRQTILIAALAALLASAIGLPVGGLTGMWNSPVTPVVLMIVNAMLAIPGLIIALVVLTVLGRGTLPLIVALGISQTASFAFVTLSAVRVVRSEAYVEAAVGMGAGFFYVLRHHVLPSVKPTVLAYLGVVFSYTVLNSAALSFLGFGNEPGTPDWGVILAEGRAAFRAAPWISIAPGVAITLTVWAVNDLADKAAMRRTSVKY